MKITFEDGNRGKGDKIILVDGHKISIEELADEAVGCVNFRAYNGIDETEFFSFINECLDAQKVSNKILNHYFHTLSEEDVARIAVEIYKNEERIYPRSNGYEGGERFRSFLNDCLLAGEVDDFILERYNLKK